MPIIEKLPHLNASLNAIATVLLMAGLVCIKTGKRQAHKRVMLTAFAVSVAFLVSYLTYHFSVEHREFPRTATGIVRAGYFAMLISHVILAATVPVLALVTIYLGLRDRLESHRRIARITFPIWLYVSVTGVAIYFMLYWVYPPAM